MMTRTPLNWLDLHWPRETTAEQQLGALALLATLGGSPILLSAVGSPGLVSHSLAVPEGHAEHMTHQLSAITPGLRVDPRTSTVPPALDRAIEIRLSTRHRPLVASDATIVNRAILTALANVHGNERISLLWILGTPLRPFAVPNHLTALPSDSWLKDLARAPFASRRPIDTDARNALRDKQALPGWKVAGFVGVHATGRIRQRQLIGQVLAALRTTEAPGVAFWVRSINPERVIEARVPWRFPLRLNVDELASLSSWPVGDTSDLPVLAQRTRLIAGRPELSRKGRVLGVSTFPGPERPIAITASDSLRHTHVLGRSGVGKSTLLGHLIEHDMNAGHAIVVIEPKSDLINDVLARVPDHRVNDVVLLDPKDVLSTVGLNPLASATQHPEIVADQILAVFKSLYGSMLGPRTTDILSASLHTLCRVPGASLAGLPLILSDAGYRRRCLAYVNDPIALEPFWAGFEAWSEAARTEAIAPLLNKVRPLLLRPQLRAVLGQSHPRFDIRDVFTKRRILLVDCSKGELGPETSALLGSLVVSQLWSATLERTAIAPERRHPVSVVLDEFQDYLRLPTDLGDALAQARGLGVGFTLAHQYLHQLDPAMRSALANVQNRICFNLAEEDARIMASPGSGLEPEDFANLGAYEFYARLVAQSAIMPWCSGKSLPSSPLVRNPEDVRAASRLNYGRSRAEVDAEIRGLTGRTSQESHQDIAPLRRPGSAS